MRRSRRLLPDPDRTPPPVGVAFTSRVGGRRMWSRYDEAAVTKELQVLCDHGLTLTRSYFFWPDLMPGPHQIDPGVLDKFGNFLDLHASLGLRTVPTLLAAYPSGQSWAPAWRDGRDLYTDVWLVGRQAWLAEQVARRFGAHPAVAGWLVGGDVPREGGGASPDAVSAWARLVIQGLRAGGATQPISLGDGDLATKAPVDWVGLHVYPAGREPAREHLRAGFLCDLAAGAGKPVIVEEFGAAGDLAREENLGRYYRQVLHNSLLGGATGWIARGGAELAEPSPALREIAAFRAVLDEVVPHQCVRTPAEVGIVLAAEHPEALAPIEQAYLACREAGTPPGLIREHKGIVADCRLYLVPSTKELTGQGWRRLEELARRGATVYASYSGPGYPGIDRVFGVRHQLPYGRVDPIGADTVRLTLRDDLGNLIAGTQLRFATGGDPALPGYLPVEPVEAQVLATDQEDRPALLHRPLGAGALIFCNYPLEAMAASAVAGSADIGRLYAALAHAAGAHPFVQLDHGSVLVDCLDHVDGTRFVWLVSQASTPVRVTPRTRNGRPLADLRTALPVSTVELPPFGVRVLRTW